MADVDKQLQARQSFLGLHHTLSGLHLNFLSTYFLLIAMVCDQSMLYTVLMLPNLFSHPLSTG